MGQQKEDPDERRTRRFESVSLIEKIQIIGHVCHDKIKEDYVLGGTASYASIMATKLSRKVCLTTSYGPDFSFHAYFKSINVDISCIPSARTTIFENIYHQGFRTQYLHQKASDIDVDSGLLHDDADVILLCPIANEVNITGLDTSMHKGLLAATIQGWLRTFEVDGRVTVRLPDLSLMKGLDIILLSDDDINGFPECIDILKGLVPLVVMTRGDKGVDVFYKNKRINFPAIPTNPVDLTGAGDIFSVAFLCAYARDRNISTAVSFGQSAASLSIEGKGISAIPNLNDIQNRLNVYHKDYL